MYYLGMTARHQLPIEATLLHGRMAELFRRFGVEEARGEVSIRYVLAQYADPARHYHTLEHLNECMVGVDWVEKRVGGVVASSPAFFKRLQTIELALWYHDVAYDPKSRLNEEVSATVFRDHAREMHLDAALVEEVCDAIMATQHKAVPTTPVAKTVVDIDLRILGTVEAHFDDYERKVREEFDWVPDDLYIAGRTTVLQDFLARDWIYSTADFRKLFEGEARANLKRSLARLARGEVLRMVR